MTEGGRPRWQSVLKWIGLWLLAQLIGGFTAAALIGKGATGAETVLSALIFLSMIVYAMVTRGRHRALSYAVDRRIAPTPPEER
jgi:hypothetical protein